jgi:lipoprotein-anchoring transpeptidase ErfK/SrfK
MDATLKWIGGTTLAVVLALGALTFGGGLIAESATADDAVVAAVTTEQVRIDPRPAIQAKIAADAERRAAERFTIKRVLPIEGPMKYGEWHWDTEGVPQDGKLVVTVDLEARVVSVFRDGYEIGAAVAMLGTDSHPTPVGNFPILTKERHNVSEKYGNAPMPWTLRLTWDGIAIHGGNVVENGYASHGCIAVPDPFADKLFDAARTGDLVVITRGQRIGMGDSLL